MERLRITRVDLGILVRNRRGASNVEYVMILVVILVICVAAYKVLALSVSSKVGTATSSIAAGGGGQGQAAAGGRAGGAGNDTAGGAGGTGAAAGGKGGAAGAGGAGGATATRGHGNEFDPDGTHSLRTGGGSGDTGSGNVPRFLLLVFGVLGAAGAFFAIMKAKHSASS